MPPEAPVISAIFPVAALDAIRAISDFPSSIRINDYKHNHW
jgi:hypothetical protein